MPAPEPPKNFVRRVELINSRRVAIGLSMTELAKLMHVSVSKVSNVLSRYAVPLKGGTNFLIRMEITVRECMRGERDFQPRKANILNGMKVEVPRVSPEEAAVLEKLRVELGLSKQELRDFWGYNDHRDVRTHLPTRTQYEQAWQYLYNLKKGVIIRMPSLTTVRRMLYDFPVSHVKLMETRLELAELRSLSDCRAQSYEAHSPGSGHSDPAADYSTSIIMLEQQEKKLAAKVEPVLEARCILKHRNDEPSRLMMIIMERKYFGQSIWAKLAAKCGVTPEYLHEVDRGLLNLCRECLVKYKRE